MNRYLKNAIAVSACIALAAIAFCAIQISLTVRELGAPIAHLTTTTLPAADLAIDQLKQDTITANAAIAQTIDLQKNLNRRITDTSQNLNAILIQSGLVADEVRRASLKQQQYWDNIGRDTDGFMRNMNTGAIALQSNMNDLHQLLSDNHLKESIAEANGILADAHEMTTDAKKVVRRYSKPPTLAQKIVNDIKVVGGLSYIIVKTINLLP